MADTLPKECGQCIKVRVVETGAPEPLVTLPRRLQNTKKAIQVCGYCDGKELLAIAFKNS